MIRFILVFSGFILYLILTLVIVPFGLLIGVFNRKARDYMFLRMVQGAFKSFLFITGTKLTVIGEENIPRDRAVLYIGNHRSYFDILVTYSRCPGLTGYVAKKSLQKVPLLNMWMKFLYCLFLDRDNMKEGMKMILTGVEYLKKGISVCIFPEGTRSKNGNRIGEFKGGSFKSATKSKCPIVPVALIDSFKPFDTKSISHVTVQVHFLKPMYYDDYKGMKTTEIAALVHDRIQDTIDKYE